MLYISLSTRAVLTIFDEPTFKRSIFQSVFWWCAISFCYFLYEKVSAFKFWTFYYKIETNTVSMLFNLCMTDHCSHFSSNGFCTLIFTDTSLYCVVIHCMCKIFIHPKLAKFHCTLHYTVSPIFMTGFCDSICIAEILTVCINTLKYSCNPNIDLKRNLKFI